MPGLTSGAGSMAGSAQGFACEPGGENVSRKPPHVKCFEDIKVDGTSAISEKATHWPDWTRRRALSVQIAVDGVGALWIGENESGMMASEGRRVGGGEGLGGSVRESGS